jgi:hypothetical protein
MSATTNEITSTSGAATGSNRADSTDTPIPLWPEGVLAVIAGVTLLVIGMRHRTWIQRKSGEVQRTVSEFQKQGGLDELTQVAQHAAELVKGKR